MKKLPILGLIVLVSIVEQTVSAQGIQNGSFTAPPILSPTGPITDWNTTVGIGGSGGDPSISMGQPSGPTVPVNGTNQALVNSTGANPPNNFIPVFGPQNSVPAATLQTFLGVSSLPNSANGSSAFNGEAIQQTFTTPGLGGGKITFLYSYQSREAPTNGGDETGYSLNGTFHILADTNTRPGDQIFGSGSAFFVWSLPYQQGTIIVGPGVNNLGFAAYNTGDGASPSGLYLDDFVFTPLFSTIPGLTPNQTAVATYIEANDLNPSLANLITALTGATTVNQLGDDLDQLSPQSLQVFRNIAFDNATFNTLDVTNHLANLRDGLTGFDGSQLSVNDTSLSPGASRIKSRLEDPKDMRSMRDPKDMKEMQPASAQVPLDRWSTFIVGDVILADLSHDQDMAHQNYTTGSVMLGADYRIDDHFTVGAFVDYSHTDADLDHIGSSATVDSYSPGIYASYVDGGWYGNALFAYGFNSYTEDRNFSFGGIDGWNHGAPQGNQYTGSLTGGYEFRSGNFKYGPIAGVQYVNLGINSFNEDGPTALDVQSESAESFRTQLGVEARYVTRVGSIYLVPHASATWQHECLDNSSGITSSFDGIGGAFTVQTTSIDRDSAVIDVGLNADVTDNVTLFTDYQTEAGQSDFFAQSVAAGVKIGF